VVGRGEIWWHEHPIRGARPHLILSRNEAIPLLNQVIAIPTTRTIRGIPTEVALDEADGMPAACVLALDNIGLIRPALCTSLITTLSAQKLRDVCEALRLAVAC
jgi:mRNA interferase MazF